MRLKSFTVLLLALLSFSCDEDFLERTPLDSLSPEVFYSEAASLEPGLTGVYEGLTNNSAFGGSLIELDAITDNGLAINSNEVTDYINFGLGNISSNVTGKIPATYQATYQVIQRANLLLANINAPGPITPALRTTIEFEARGLRAIAYMRLAYLFGSVPLVTAPITRAEAISLSSASNDEIIDFVLKELQATATNLAVKPYNNQAGRLTKSAALAFRAKVLVFEARKGKKPWNDALAALKEVKALAETNGVKLFTTGDGSNGQLNFETLFQLKGENNPEILFAVKGNPTELLKSVLNYYTPAATILEFCVHTNLVNDFYTRNGLPISDPASDYNPDSAYANRDPRLQASIVVPGSMYSNGIALVPFPGKIANARLLTDFSVRKTGSLDGIIPNRGELDVIVLRYADVLLMLAEAENAVNGPSAAAYEPINQVRARVAMPAVKPNLTKEQFQAEVIHERRVELAFEGHRWYDLVTLGIADRVVNNIKEFNRAFVASRQELFPIPQSEIDLNPKLKQNPGY